MPRLALARIALVVASLAALAALGCRPSSGRVRCPGVGQPPPSPLLCAPAVAAAPAASASAATAPAASYQGHGLGTVSPELLAKHVAAPLSPEDSRHIQAMLDVRSPQGGLVSSDGKRMYFGWTVTGTMQLWRLDGPMSFPVQLTGGEDSTALSGLTPDGKWLLVSRDRSGEENPGLYLLSPDGGALKPIQHKPGVQTFLDRITDDSKALYFHANDIQSDSYAIYRYDLGTGHRETVYAEPGLWSVADERGGKLLLEKNVGSNMNEYYELDASSKALTALIGQGEREDYVASYGALPDELLVLTPKLGEFRRLYSWHKGELKPLTAALEHDVASFAIDRQRQRIVYTVNEGGYTRAFALDAKTKQALALPKLPAADHVLTSSISANGRYATLMIDQGTAPPQAFVYDWQSRKLEAWHKPAAPEMDTSTFARASLESYPARDGTLIPMFVRRPAGCVARPDSPCPVVVSFHGGPEGQAVAGFSTRAQLFVDAGFVYVEPNVRGSDGYGKTWIHADDGLKRMSVITDIDDAARYIRSAWTAGGKEPRIGIYGGSYGGYAALMGMSLFAGSYDVGVSVVGISSLPTFLRNTAPYRRALRISEYGDPERDQAVLELLSPLHHADRIVAPTLLIQGATDPRVPVGEALQLYDVLQRKGIASELIIFPDEGHGMRKRGNQVLAMGHTLRFFQQHLK